MNLPSMNLGLGDQGRKLRWAALGCLAVDLVLIVLLMSPWGRTKADAAADLQQVEQQYLTLRDRALQLRQFESRLRSAKAAGDQLVAQQMPEERRVYSRVLAELVDRARRHQVQLSGIGFVPAEKVFGGLRAISITARMQGRYQDSVEFLNDIERAPTFYAIQQISLSSSGETTAAQGLHLDLHLITYARSQEPDSKVFAGDEGSTP